MCFSPKAGVVSILISLKLHDWRRAEETEPALS